MQFVGDPSQSTGPRRVRVVGREEIGEVINEGKNLGSSFNVYAVMVHFPSSGECVYYDKSRVSDVN
jgi:hypothetical protein